MAVRNGLRMVKCSIKAPLFASFRRFLTTDSARTQLADVKFGLDFGAHLRAQPGKDVCEDAYFIWEKHRTAAFGVADGVSSWRYDGVDAAMFPNVLMANCLKHLEANQGKICPKHLLYVAYQEILQSNQVEAGSSTVCLGILDKENGLLQIVNLGDSGFCIFRNGQTVFKSKEQYQDWNVPFQVGVKEIVDGQSIPHGNSPSDAVISQFTLEDGDMVIWGTDGLFDNMFPEDILDVIQPHWSKGRIIDWNATARQLTKIALTQSVEIKPERITPREQRMVKYNEDSLEIPGGNFDDVTVVVAHIRTQ